uniref:Phospholipase-like protein n=1 Tax=Tanacetum cinerariifolium TaxID=118510 RepID=A0A6L2L8M4_TANCI|nr:hypothetical protein [Tanacetum cinerariifolium]
MLKPSPDTGIDSIFNLNTESTPRVDVLVTTTAKLPLLSATLPPSPTPIIPTLQQTPVPSPTNVPSSSLQDLPNFESLFGFDHRLKALEINFPEFMQTNQFAKAISLILGIVDKYLDHRMNEPVKVVVQLQSDKLRDEAQAENVDFLNKLDENIQNIIKEQVKKKVKAQVSKILPKIEKIVNEQLEAKVLTRSSNSSKTSHVKNLYKSLVDAYECDKLILDTYGDMITLKRRQDDEDKDEEPFAGSNWGSKRRRAGKETKSTSAPKETNSKTTGKSTEGSKSHHKSASKSAPTEKPIGSQHPNWFQKQAKPPTPDRAWNKTLPATHGPIQPWISNLARKDDSCTSFNELMDTPLDFSAFVMNQLKVDTLTPEILVGLTYELMKGSCKSLVKLEFFIEEVYKATTNQLDWNSPEGQQYLHDLRKPLPLIPNSRGHYVIPFDLFINNDLEYLRGGVSSRIYTTSVMKTKAADYDDIKWIEDLVPHIMWSQVPVSYDKHALWGISHWGRKCHQFYRFAVNKESARDVYSKHRIIAVTMLQIVEWHNYKHLDWITIRRDDDKLYKFKEGDFKRLRIQDIKDMLLLLVQGKLSNLTVDERLAFNVFLRMFTRSIVIQRRVEDLQLGVESYQKKINLIKMDTDDTLNDVRTALDDRLKGIQMQYLPQTIWRRSDKDRATTMILAIDKQLKTRRIMWSLENFVGSSSTLIYSPGSSTPLRYSLGASTPQRYSLGTSRNAEYSNYKHLLDKITVLEATMDMYMHPEQHTVNSTALFHEVYNNMEKLDLE